VVKYVIRPSKRQELLELINERYTGNKRSRGKCVVIYNKPMTYTRWANWFDLDTLDDALMEEGYEEVEVPNENVFDETATEEDVANAMNFDVKDLGI